MNVLGMTAEQVMYQFHRSQVTPLAHYEAAAPFVYFIATKGWFKIGYANDPERRITELLEEGDLTFKPESWSGKASLVAYQHGTYQDESQLHAEFAHLRGNGEWFKDDPQLRKYIAATGLAQSKAELKLHNHLLEQLAEKLDVEHNPLSTDAVAVNEHFGTILKRQPPFQYMGKKIKSTPTEPKP